MNNSLLEIDTEEPVVDVKPVLRKRQSELLKIIETIQTVSSSKEWQALNELVFKGQVENLKRKLETESNKIELNAPEIYRLQGELKWAKRYSDFYKLAETYKTELDNLLQKLNENAITI